jgi:DNA-binding MarR family transcriptional regulator
LGFSVGHIAIVLALGRQGRLSQKQLVEQAVIEQPTMAATLKRMEKSGLIVREADPLDGRVSLFRLSKKSTRVLDKFYEALEEGNTVALAGVTMAEKALLVRLLQRVVGNLSTDIAATGAARSASKIKSTQR